MPLIAKTSVSARTFVRMPAIVALTAAAFQVREYVDATFTVT
jgi:hypothetical protein